MKFAVRFCGRDMKRVRDREHEVHSSLGRDRVIGTYRESQWFNESKRTLLVSVRRALENITHPLKRTLEVPVIT